MSFNMNTGASAQGNMIASNYIVNLIELQNVVTSATGLTPIEQVQSQVNQLQTMVNFDQKRIFTNIISKFDTTPIQITDDINLSNATIFQNGQLFVGGGGGGGTSGGGFVISSGGTSIILNSTLGVSSTAIGFQIGGRTVFSFDGAGRALYYDPSGTGDRFWVSSATLVADKIQIGGSAAGAAAGKFLQSIDSLGTGQWAFVSSLTTGAPPLVALSSSGIFFRTGIAVGSDAGRIDSNRNWYLGLPSFTGNNDLVTSNDVTVIGGGLRYQGGGAAIPGAVLTVADSLGNVKLSTFQLSGLSSFVVGDKIQSGLTAVTANGVGQFVTITQGANELARFTSAGYLGISNALPAATLDVGGPGIVRGSLTVNPGTGGTNWVLTANGVGGVGSWAPPAQLFSASGQEAWILNSGLGAIQGVLGGSEFVRFSTAGAKLGVSGPYELDVNGVVAAAAFASFSPLRFWIGTGQKEVGRFLDNGNFGIGTSTPGYKLTVAGSQSNQDALFVSTNATIYGILNAATIIGGSVTATTLAGNGAAITGIQTNNVGSGSNRLDLFQAETRSNVVVLQIGLSTLSTSVFSTLNYYNIQGGLAFYSTLSSAIGPGAGAVVSSYSTQVGIAMAAQFSTLSSYIVTNTVQFSTLSSVIQQTSFSDRAYASTVAFSTASTLDTLAISSLLGNGFAVRRANKAAVAAVEISGNLLMDRGARIWISSPGALGINYKTGTDLSGAIDVSGLIYSRGLRGLAAPWSLGVGASTTAIFTTPAYTYGVGLRLNLQGDLDLSGRLFRNGQLYTVDGVPDVYWSRNGSNLWYATGNVGIGTYTPSYPLDVAGRIRCYGVDVIPGPGPMTSTQQGLYVSPWVYQGSNIYYDQGGAGIGKGFSTVKAGVSWDVSGPVRIQYGPTYMSSLAVNIPYGSTLVAGADIFASLRARSLVVDSTGVFGGRVTARDFLSLSDQRLKEDIRLISDAGGSLDRIRGVRFQWRGSERADVGVLAQEVAAVIPEAVEGDEESGFHVAYDKVIPFLLEAVKDLRKRVAVLEGERV